MAGHLAVCSACAEWARRADRLDQLWEATRPPDPSAEAWDAVWAHVAGELPRPVAADHDGATASGPRPSLNGGGVKVLAHTAQAPAPAPTGVGPRSRRRSWRLAGVALVGLAQAAAILVAMGLAWQPSPHPESLTTTDDIVPPGLVPRAPSPIRVAKAVKVDVEFDGGCRMVIHAEGTTVRIVNATPPEMNSSSDGGLEILNAMESIPTPQVAAR